MRGEKRGGVMKLERKRMGGHWKRSGWIGNKGVGEIRTMKKDRRDTPVLIDYYAVEAE